MWLRYLEESYECFFDKVGHCITHGSIHNIFVCCFCLLLLLDVNANLITGNVNTNRVANVGILYSK